MTTIEIPKAAEELLSTLRQENPALDNAEILQRALAEYRKRLLRERRAAWAKSLPTTELSEEEKRSVAEARGGEFVELSIDELERYADAPDDA